MAQTAAPAAATSVATKGPTDQNSNCRSEAIAEFVQLGTEAAVQGIVMRGIGGAPGFAVGLVLGMRSDDREVSRQLAIEEMRQDAVTTFVDTYLPETVTINDWWITTTRSYDPIVRDQVYRLLFEYDRPLPLDGLGPSRRVRGLTVSTEDTLPDGGPVPDPHRTIRNANQTVPP